MTEFKGTKGKWLYDSSQEAILSDSLHMIADIFPPCSMENALLISKAPEMLEMLIDFVGTYESGGIINNEYYIGKFKQLIKEATEL